MVEEKFCFGCQCDGYQSLYPYFPILDIILHILIKSFMSYRDSDWRRGPARSDFGGRGDRDFGRGGDRDREFGGRRDMGRDDRDRDRGFGGRRMDVDDRRGPTRADEGGSWRSAGPPALREK